MRQNVVILTTGLSGSSVLAGLIARAGYWTGDSTYKKTDYDTYENEELIHVNRRLFQEAGFIGNSMHHFSLEAVQQLSSASSRVAPGPYRQFLNKCNDHRPWLWKDPQLWLAIHYWKELLDLEDCKFLLLSRSYTQWWLSTTLRGQIRSFKSFRNYEQSVQESIGRFLKQVGQPYLKVRYEDLIRDPAETIDALNRHLNTELTVADLKEVYHRPLYRIPRKSWLDHLKAALIYLRNYPRRMDVSSGQD